MEESIKLDRTWLCSVLFLDITQYSRQSLEVQTHWKRRFNQYLGEAIKECPDSERVILDTGDGAAICFLGDPETAMFSALRLLSAVGQEKGQQANPLRVRAGINLGSVKLVKDINGNLNAVGDGINVGQRVMSFATDNQILVSRSFYEVASSLSESYAGLFKYEGVRTDKHVREHTLYVLHAPDVKETAAEASHTVLYRNAPLTPPQLAKVEANLAALVGPIAKHLVKNASLRAASTAEFRDSLWAFIPNKADQEKFLKTCGDIFSPPKAEPPPTAVPVAPQEKIVTTWEASTLERIRKELAMYIGPMAKVMVDRAAAKAQTRTALYQMLAEEISSPKDREKFLRQASAS
jgi:class 3 adenylate cyclase